MLPSQIDRLVPSGTVQERALEGLDTWNWWPAPGIEDSGGVDHKVAVLLEDGPVLFANLHDPFALILFPLSSDDFMPKTDVTAKVILIKKIVEVGKDLARRGIVGGPVCLRLEGISVVVAVIYSVSAKFLFFIFPTVLGNTNIKLTQAHHRHTRGTDSQTRFPQCRGSFHKHPIRNQ